MRHCRAQATSTSVADQKPARANGRGDAAAVHLKPSAPRGSSVPRGLGCGLRPSERSCRWRAVSARVGGRRRGVLRWVSGWPARMALARGGRRVSRRLGGVPALPGIRSRSVSLPVSRCPRVLCYGRGWRLSRSAVAGWAPSRWSWAGRWPTTRRSDGSCSAGRWLRERRGRTVSTWRCRGLSRRAGTSIGLWRAARSVRSGARGPRPLRRSCRGSCGSGWVRASTSSRATTRLTVT